MNDENYFSFDENTCNLASFSNYALQQDIWGLRPVSYMRTTESSKYHNINTQQHMKCVMIMNIIFFNLRGLWLFYRFKNEYCYSLYYNIFSDAIYYH